MVLSLIFFLSVVYNFLTTFVPLILVVAFITLFERKVMASMQRRRGPNVVGFFGLLQPFADGIKLILKSSIFPYQADLFLYIVAPVLTFVVSILSWVVVPLSFKLFGLYFDLSLLFILSTSSLGVYGILLAGWSSNSKYAFFGSIRSAAQMISYEVGMSLAILPVVILTQSYNLVEIVYLQKFCWFAVPLLASSIFFLITLLAETNRSPFDLPEAEGELVAGYNVEYSAFFFACFYLAEYFNILLLSTIFVLLFLGGPFFFFMESFLFLGVKVLLIVFFVIWVRATLPRYRYDQLMQIGWKLLLPLTTGYTVFISGIFYFFLQII